MSMDWVLPKWKAPLWVQAFTTSRNSGFSQGLYASFNLSYDVGDLKFNVDENRQQLSTFLGRRCPFLQLEHGTQIIEVKEEYPANLSADGAIIRQSGLMIGLLTADCLPVFFSDHEGSFVAIAHAGWRGLAAGILAKMVKQIGVAPEKLSVFIGPAIHSLHYYVGKEVFEAFVSTDINLRDFFTLSNNPEQPKKAQCDLRAIANYQLRKLAVTDINISAHDTYRDSHLFFSYRRDHITGRMANVVCLREGPEKPPPKKQLSMANLDQTIRQQLTQSPPKNVDIEL